MKDYIYADNAATTRLDADAFEAMKPFLLDEFGNVSQPYSFAKNAKKALRQARISIAECINAEPEEIFFTSGGTESDNWAIKEFGSRENERFILTSEIEHHAVLNACNKVAGEGRHVLLLHVDSKGIVSGQDLRDKLKVICRNNQNGRDVLVSIMLANNEIGSIEPISELACIAREFGAVFHTDAVQAVGHIPIDVKKMGIDMLSASAHKFNGPKGIGFLYKRKGICISSHNDGGSQEFGLRAGTENVAYIVAMATALRKNCDHIKENCIKLKKLEDVFISGLENAGIDYIRNGINQLPGNVSISFADSSGEMLLHRLDLKHICVSTGSACDGERTQVSHVIKAVGVPAKYAKGTIRLSFGRNNTEEDASIIVKAILEIINEKA